MKIFLTSSHTLGWAGDLNPANGFADALRAALPRDIFCLMITSYPDDEIITDRMAWEIRECFDRAEMRFSFFEVLDRRTQAEAARMIKQANFIILCGGHVPTENRFFREIRLRQRLKNWDNWDGVLMTISAGSMNCAETVYSSPELPGEAVDPKYKIHLRGLGLTNINILPHFQQLKDEMLDGMRLVDEIVARHSYQHPIYCLPDGSYFLITPEQTELHGLCYKMQDGELRMICRDNETKFCRHVSFCKPIF